MGRHRHVVNVRADGIAVVLGPLLRDVRIVAAALVDVESGMVLDAWSAGGALTGAPDLELIGAQHAEILRCALQVLRTWTGAGDPAGACEVVLGADDGCRHLLRTVPDPHGDRLALAVVVDGPQRVLDRVRKRLQSVSVDALTAGPSMTRRPSGSGWSFEPPGPEVPAAPAPGAGLLPPGSRPPDPGPDGHVPVPLPRPRDGRPVPSPGPGRPSVTPPATPQSATPQSATPSSAPPPLRGPGAVPAMSGLVRPVPGAPADRPRATHAGPDDAAVTRGHDGIASVVIPDAAAARPPVLFSVPHGDLQPNPRPAAPAGEPAAPAASTAAPSTGPRRPSPPAALPAPPRPQPPRA